MCGLVMGSKQLTHFTQPIGGDAICNCIHLGLEKGPFRAKVINLGEGKWDQNFSSQSSPYLPTLAFHRTTSVWGYKG